MKKLGYFVLLTLMLWCAASPCFATEADPQAMLAVESFTATIDAGSLEDAYWNSSALLQMTQTQDDWADEVFALQQKLGRPLQRDLYRVREVTTFPGLPDGHYLLVYYRTRMEYKEMAHEIVLLRQAEDLWKVCYYRLR